MNRINFYHRQQVWDWHLEWESKAIRDTIRQIENDFHGYGILTGLEVTGTGVVNEVQVALGAGYTKITTFETDQDPGVNKFSERVFLTSNVKQTFPNVLGQQYRVLLKYKEALTGDEEEPIGGGVKRKVKIESSAEVTITTDVIIPADAVLLAIVTGTGLGNTIPDSKIDSSVRVYITKSSHGHTGGIDGPQLTEDALLDEAVTTPKIADEAVRAHHVPDGEIPLSKLASLVQAKWADENLILNSDFEYIIGSGSLPSFWTKEESVGNVVTRDTDSLFGKYSIKLTKSALGTLKHYSDDILIQSSTGYALSGYIKNLLGITKNARIKVFIYDSNNVLVGSHQTTQSDSSVYSRHSVTFTTPSNASYVVVECLVDTNETGTFWFDDLKLEEGSSVTTYLPNLSDSAMREILNALDAGEISIEDAESLYTAEDVENALAEIMTDFNAHNTKEAHDAFNIDADTLDTKHYSDIANEIDADIAAHIANANAHHTKFTIVEHDTTARHSLGTVVPHDALASLTEKAHGSLTGVTTSQHHIKTSKLSEITIDVDKNWAGKAINSPGNVDGVDISEFVKGFNAKARAWRNGLQNINTDTVTIVQLDNESYDPGDNFDTNTHRFTAPYSGYYAIPTMATFAHNHPANQLPADKAYQVFLYKNGSTRLLNAGIHSSWGGALGCAASDIYYLAEGDYVDMRVWHNAGITIELWGYEHSTFMAAHLLSKT